MREYEKLQDKLQDDINNFNQKSKEFADFRDEEMRKINVILLLVLILHL